jgi:AcrR family transcriptional regulator
MATRKTARGEASRQNLLDAANRVFRRRGFALASVRDIAEEAGVALGGLYRHFPSKEHFIAAVLVDGMREINAEVRQAIESLPAGATLRDRIAAAIQAQATSTRRRGGTFDQAVRYERSSDSPRSVWKPYRDAVSAYRAMWKTLIVAAQQRGEIRKGLSATMLAFYLLGSVVWINQWHRPQGRTIDRVANDFADYFLDGVRERKASRGRARRAQSA